MAYPAELYTYFALENRTEITNVLAELNTRKVAKSLFALVEPYLSDRSIGASRWFCFQICNRPHMPPAISQIEIETIKMIYHDTKA